MRIRCDDCEGEWDFFKLKNKVWLLIAPTSKGVFCLRCAESRLGRPMTPDDFTNESINEPIRFGYRMARNDRIVSDRKGPDR